MLRLYLGYINEGRINGSIASRSSSFFTGHHPHLAESRPGYWSKSNSELVRSGILHNDGAVEVRVLDDLTQASSCSRRGEDYCKDNASASYSELLASPLWRKETRLVTVNDLVSYLRLGLDQCACERNDDAVDKGTGYASAVCEH